MLAEERAALAEEVRSAREMSDSDQLKPSLEPEAG